MRDPDRIPGFCARLAVAWRRVPDLRFGQFMCNMLGDFIRETGMDPFFPEDDVMIAFIEKYTAEQAPQEE